MTGQQREKVASTAQYFLLGGFAAVAAGISAQGLTGFARSNMALRGPWPELLFFALDGAAGVCAVLLARRAARDEGGLAPRLAAWGLVGASAFFNFTHAPRRPAAPQAYALMPVIAAVLFEFCLREMRSRRTGRADRKLSGLRWLHPAERARVQLHLAADGHASAEEATRRIRTGQAARRLYRLRMALRACDRPGRPGALATGRARSAQRRAHRALIRAGFADPAVAAEVLRQVQILTMTTTLARLDYASPDAAQAAIASLITSPATPTPEADNPPAQLQAPVHSADGQAGEHDHRPAAPLNGQITSSAVTGANKPLSTSADSAPAPAMAASPQDDAARADDPDAQLIVAAARIVADTAQEGGRLSQIALAGKLRSQGYTISNEKLRWLAAVSGLESRPGRPPANRPPARTERHTHQREADEPDRQPPGAP